MRRTALVAVVLAACTPSSSGPRLYDIAMAPRDGAIADLTAAPDLASATDGAPPPADLATTTADLATAKADLAVACAPPRVNELMTTGNGGASDEFIEIHNPCAKVLDLTGYALVYRAAMGASDLPLVTFNALTVGANGHVVAGQQAYAGMADVRYGNSMANAGGAVALLAPGGAVVDSVGWGTATNAYVENQPAPATPDGQSIGRFPDGTDTNHNKNDFRVFAQPTPRAKNQ
jgi:hypothetical protein